MSQNNKPDYYKTIGVAALGVVAFAVLYNLFLGGRSGYGFSMGYGRSMHDGYGMSGGFGGGLDLNSLLASILGIAVQLLWVLFIVGLVVGVVIIVKKYAFEDKKLNLNFLDKLSDGYTCPCCQTKLAAEFKFCPNCKASLKDVCAKCGRELQVGWNCCPSCGTEKEAAAK